MNRLTGSIGILSSIFEIERDGKTYEFRAEVSAVDDCSPGPERGDDCVTDFTITEIYDEDGNEVTGHEFDWVRHQVDQDEALVEHILDTLTIDASGLARDMGDIEDTIGDRLYEERRDREMLDALGEK